MPCYIALSSLVTQEALTSALGSIQEIRGTLFINSYNMLSLPFLKNVRHIGSTNPSDLIDASTLSIQLNTDRVAVYMQGNSFLESIDLSSLESIPGGDVLLDNNQDLCFVGNFSHYIVDPSSQVVALDIKPRKDVDECGTYCVQCTKESLNKDTLGQLLLSFIERLSSLGGPKCIGTVGKNISWPQVVYFVERVFLFRSVHYRRFLCIVCIWPILSYSMVVLHMHVCRDGAETKWLPIIINLHYAQCNPSIPDTLGPERTALIIGVFSFQGLNMCCIKLWWRFWFQWRMSIIEVCLRLTVWIRGVHCIYTAVLICMCALSFCTGYF